MVFTVVCFLGVAQLAQALTEIAPDVVDLPAWTTDEDKPTRRSEVKYDNNPFHGRRLTTRQPLRLTAYYDTSATISVDRNGATLNPPINNDYATHKTKIDAAMTEAINFYNTALKVEPAAGTISSTQFVSSSSVTPTTL